MRDLIKILCLVLFSMVAWERQADGAEYRVRDGDVLKITVYEHPDLSLTVRVGRNGSVTLPLIGEVQVRGQNEGECQRGIAVRLGDGYIVNPQVMVVVEEYKDRVFVSGEVRAPGAYQYEEGMTVLKGVTLAGGFTEKAARRRVKIVRPKKVRAEAAPAASGESPGSGSPASDGQEHLSAAQGDLIQPNDVIIVREGLF